MAVELERVDEDRHDDDVGVAASQLDEGEVAVVQSAHRRTSAETPASGAAERDPDCIAVDGRAAPRRCRSRVARSVEGVLVVGPGARLDVGHVEAVASMIAVRSSAYRLANGNGASLSPSTSCSTST